MTTLKQDLELAHALIEEKEKIREYYSIFDRMWPFTTVNMKEYLEPFNLENKKCITIQGSSDHIFELFLKHPETIVGVDTNPLTKYPYYLKQAAFAVLETPKEYLKFFRWNDYPQTFKKNRHVFDKDIYKEIEKYLTGDAKIFWKELFDCYDSIKLRTNLFNDYDEENNNALYQSLNYLSPDNYQYIRENRDKINYNFMNTDIRNLGNELIENYDFITLSNVIIYAHCMFKENSIENFKLMVESLLPKLNEHGQIVVGYLYNIEAEDEHYRDIYIENIRNMYFNEPEYSYNYIRKMKDLHRNCETEGHDACLIYTKK